MYVYCGLLQIIRILEKLSPKQAHLFSSVSVSGHVPPASISDRHETELNSSIQTSESTKDDSDGGIITTAFPFLLQSKIAADC